MKKITLLLLSLLFLSACSAPTKNYEQHYQSTFLAVKDIQIFDEERKEIGSISAGSIVILNEESDHNQEYFKLDNFPYYIYYEDVGTPTERPPFVSFPNYVLFPEEMVTKEVAHLYTLDEQLYLTINDAVHAPILIKEENFYTIQWENTYYKIPVTDIEEIVTTSSKVETASEVSVLMYHFFYNKDNGETPLDNNWLEVKQFEEQLQYLIENDYHVLSMLELEKYLKGEVLVHKKSIVITIDDGDPSVYKYAYPLLEKYQVRATTFLVTSWYWWDIDNRINPYIELQSHSHDMHKGGCNIQHGGRMLCIDFEEGVQDLITSQEYLYGAFVFCYPFGDFNNHAKEMLTAAGYRLAFTTQPGKVRPGMDLLELPRVRIHNALTLQQFIISIQ